MDNIALVLPDKKTKHPANDQECSNKEQEVSEYHA